MSVSVSVKGVYKNNKVNCVGLFIKTNGLNNSKIYFNEEDEKELLDKVNTRFNNKISINEGIENNKFKFIIVTQYVNGRKVQNYKIRLKTIDKDKIKEIIKGVNIYTSIEKNRV